MSKNKRSFEQMSWNQAYSTTIEEIKNAGYTPSTCCNVFKSYYVEFSEGVGGPYDSKAGGIPYIPNDDYWPICPRCGGEQVLLLQLNLQQLPAIPSGLPSQGLIQVFACYSIPPANWQKDARIWLSPGEYCWGKDWLHNSLAYTVRWIKPTTPATVYEVPPWVKTYQLNDKSPLMNTKTLSGELFKVKTECRNHCALFTEEAHQIAGCRQAFIWGGCYLGGWGLPEMFRDSLYFNAWVTEHRLEPERLKPPLCPICAQLLKPLFQFKLQGYEAQIDLYDGKYGGKVLAYCPDHLEALQVVSHGD